MKPYYADDTVTLHHGDALDVLRALPDASVDAVVTDPPYGLEFMGREWDSFKPSAARLRTRVDGRTNPVEGKSVTTTPEAYVAGVPFQRWCEAWSRECLRILKPGGHLLAFGGTRTVHRLTCAIEDAGFEIRDGIDWLYASGFPKSLDVSKAIGKAAGAQREVVGHRAIAYPDSDTWGVPNRSGNANQPVTTSFHGPEILPGGIRPVTAPATDDARRWSGWGTALKPAREPIVMARKPMAGTVAGNVLAYGTGALNIDATRVGTDNTVRPNGPIGYHGGGSGGVGGSDSGRWPSNVVLSHAPDCGEQTFRIEPTSLNGAAGDSGFCVPGCPVAELDRQSGTSQDTAHSRGTRHGAVYGNGAGPSGPDGVRGYTGAGGASRFFPVFRYEAKAPTAERPRTAGGTAHPTVKPLDLMRWLVRLVTPPGGTVLEPFAGSGTTAEACVLEGFRCIAIEREAAYLPLIAARLTKPLQPALDLGGTP